MTNLKVSQVSRLVNRFKTAVGGEGNLVGVDCRLSWSLSGWLLEELPQKGKKKLRKAKLINPTGRGNRIRFLNLWVPDNILRSSKISPSDDYDKIKQKITSAYEEALQEAQNITDQKVRSVQDKREVLEEAPIGLLKAEITYILGIKWREDLIHHLLVTPEGTEAFTAKGMNFEVKIEWTRFRAYAHEGDYAYGEASPTSARKLFSIMTSDPQALKSVSWTNLSAWLDQNKVPYKTLHSIRN